MPELPEVEIFTRDLRAWCEGAVLEAVELVDPRVLVDPARPEELEALAGRTVGPVWRRAKWSLLQVGDRVLALHYRMTGKPVLDDGAAGRKLRLKLHLRHPAGLRRVVALDDTRCLGGLHLLRPAEWARREATMGPDAWPERHPGSWWAERLGRGRRALKVALLDQDRVAGVGNIGASEACFRAGLDPRQPVGTLPAPAWAALAEAVPAWVDRTLEEELGQELHFVTAGGSNPFLVYGREGEPCPRCGDAIVRSVQSGRSTFWCPACQGGASPP